MSGAASPLPSDPSNGFTRTVVHVAHKPVIRSACDYCGLVITATNPAAVWDGEAEHRDCCQCPKKPPASASRD